MRINEINKNNLNFIVVTNDCNFEVIFANLGASIYSIKFDNNMMTMTPIMSSDFERENIYYGKTIGRVAGRIKNTSIKVNGLDFKLEANEGKNILHSGCHGLHTKYWESKIKENSEGIEVEYNYLSPDLESGFPGNANFKVTYFVYKNKPNIDVYFDVICDKDCPINITNHSYFCVGEKTLKDCELMIKADQFIEVDSESQIPLGTRKLPIFMNFNKFKNVLEEIDNPYLRNSKCNGYDHFYIFSGTSNQISLRGHNYQLDIDTDLDGAQIYTHNYMDNVITMQSGALQYRAIAIEPQLNQLSDNILKANQRFNAYIKYKFKKIN